MDIRKVILVADDKALLRGLIRTLLHDEGYRVLTAADKEGNQYGTKKTSNDLRRWR